MGKITHTKRFDPKSIGKSAMRLKTKLQPSLDGYEKYKKILCVGNFDKFQVEDLKKHYFVLLKNHWLACDMACEADKKVLQLQEELEKTKKDLKLVMQLAHPCTICKKKRAEFICTTCHTFISCDKCHTAKPFCTKCYPPSITMRVS